MVGSCVCCRGIGRSGNKNSGIWFPFTVECGTGFGIVVCGSVATEEMLCRRVEEEIPVSVLTVDVVCGGL